MTELIGFIFGKDQSPRKPPQDKLDRTRSSITSHLQDWKSETPQRQRQLDFIIHQPKLKYKIAFSISLRDLWHSIRASLIENDGNIVKIRNQQSKTFLLRKFMEYKNLYHPSIDPLTGAVCFRFDHFLFKSSKIQQCCMIKEKLIRNLNYEKLYQSIQKFQLLLNHGEQFNWNEQNSSMIKYHQPLTKLISRLGDANFTYPNIKKTQQEKLPPHHHKLQQNHQLKNILQQLNSFYEIQKRAPTFINENLLAKQFKKIQSQNDNLHQLTKRKQGKSNYQSLLINMKTEKTLKQNILQINDNLLVKSSMKIMQGQLGKITINLQKQDDSIYQAKKKFLLAMPKNTEYHFLDKYFKNDLNLPVLIYLSLNDQSLPKFFETNSIVMSIETKMRILVQIVSAVHTLWEERNILLLPKNQRKIFITKNLTIKIRSISQYIKIQPHMLLEQKLAVNLKLINTAIGVSQFYFKLFFKHDLFYQKPSGTSPLEKKAPEQSRIMGIVKNNIGSRILNQQLINPIRQILTRMSYIFLQFVNKAKQMIEQSTKKANQKQIFMSNESENNNQSQFDQTILNFKPVCCWLLKNLQLIVHERV